MQLSKPVNLCFLHSHHLSISKCLQEETGVKHIACGQKVNINGHVRSFPFKSIQNTVEYSIVILPEDIRVYENEEEPLQDVFSFMMSGFIKSQIFYTPEFAIFTVQQTVTVEYNNRIFGCSLECLLNSNSII